MTTDPDDTEEFDDRNVHGDELAPCSHDPETGYLRDGHCRDVDGDVGDHQLCAVMTESFLEYSRRRGNDLITPRPALGFPGLEPGDRWCLCVGRWVEAVEAAESGDSPVGDDLAPPVVLEATSESVLAAVDRETLRAHEYDAE